ncbi:MAG TPA: leucine-rich repeat domain-containing protein, partial [Beijerinckiaceae bacterium]|nr:leucine-rich repeat domain-containing protein [Beijerinckiaceae bacterium]
TQITDAAPLAGLTALTTLDLSNTQITDAAPLAGLPALQRIIVGSEKRARALAKTLVRHYRIDHDNTEPIWWEIHLEPLTRPKRP